MSGLVTRCKQTNGTLTDAERQELTVLGNTHQQRTMKRHYDSYVLNHFRLAFNWLNATTKVAR